MVEVVIWEVAEVKWYRDYEGQLVSEAVSHLRTGLAEAGQAESNGIQLIRKCFSCLLKSLVNLRVTRILDVLDSHFLKLWKFKWFLFLPPPLQLHAVFMKPEHCFYSTKDLCF